MELLEFYLNNNTGECRVSFGEPFEFPMPLTLLRPFKDGKRVIVLGLKPHTVELEINIQPEKAAEAASITSWYSDTDTMIDKLNSISVTNRVEYVKVCVL